MSNQFPTSPSFSSQPAYPTTPTGAPRTSVPGQTPMGTGTPGGSLTPGSFAAPGFSAAPGTPQPGLPGSPGAPGPVLPGTALSATSTTGSQQWETLGAWVLLLFLLPIPLVGLVIVLFLAFGNPPSEGMKHFAQASLVWALVSFVGVLVIMLVFGVSIGGLLAGLTNG